MGEEKTIVMHCSKCEKEIKPEEKCYQISTGRFVGKDTLFRAYPTDSNQYFHEGCLNILCEVMGSPGHSWQNAATSGMSIGHKGMLTAAKILAIAALDFMKNPNLVEKAKKEHEGSHKDKPYKSPLPEGLKTPHLMLKN